MFVASAISISLLTINPMNSIPVEWKYEGSFLKMGIKKYVLPSQQQVRVCFLFSPYLQDYEIIERVNKSGHDVDRADGMMISKQNGLTIRS